MEKSLASLERLRSVLARAAVAVECAVEGFAGFASKLMGCVRSDRLFFYLVCATPLPQVVRRIDSVGFVLRAG